MIQPLLINSLIKYFHSGEDRTSFTHAIVQALLTCLAIFAFIILHHPYGYQVTRFGMQIRIATCGLIYRKVTFNKKDLFEKFLRNTCVHSKLMRMSIAENQSDEKIDVLNLLSNDAARVNQSTYVAVYLFVAPLAILVNTIILVTQISFSTLGGLLLLLLAIPLQIMLNTNLTKIK
jgi:hypothetical protein